MQGAVAEELETVGAVVARGALVNLANIYSVLESAVLDEGAVGNALIVPREAHDEAKADLGVGVELAGAELDNVAQALGRAVLALDTVVGDTECKGC